MVRPAVPPALAGPARSPSPPFVRLAAGRGAGGRRRVATARVISSGSAPRRAGRLPFSQSVARPCTSDQAATPASSSGTLGSSLPYSSRAAVARKRFWTFSVWADQASLDAFAASDPHRRIIRWLGPLMGKTRFEFFRISGSQLPMTWEQMSAPVRG